MMTNYPKRLIEVDLPIKRISEHARREKSIRHGHISTLHIWWARRPLAACRAVICAALWLDPVDENCPPAFRRAAARVMNEFAQKVVKERTLAESCSQDAFGYWMALAKPEGKIDPTNPQHQNVLRRALLFFIGDFANWDNSTTPAYLETARALTQAAHEALGGAPGTRPLVVDPFAGGGSIPLEALRVGADAFASDLNPVAVLLNKVVLEYIPKYGQQLADEVRKWGEWIKKEAEKELAEFYPKDPDGATPIAYLWARTITCEGPNCGTKVPLMRSLWLAKKGERSVALQIIPDKKNKCVDFEIIEKKNGKWVKQNDSKAETKNPNFDGTVKRGSATCPVCGYTTPVASVRKQLKARKGGAADARLFCVVTTKATEQGRFYRLPTKRDLDAVRKAAQELEKRKREHKGGLSLVPDEDAPPQGALSCRNAIYGLEKWGDFFAVRQALMLTIFLHTLQRASESCEKNLGVELAKAVQTIIACAIDREAEHSSSLCRWNPSAQKMQATFGRQALPMVWDYAETNPFGGSVGSWDSMMECVIIPFESVLSIQSQGHIELANATLHPLPDDIAQSFITDPPYYDAINYANISDFFYVWLKRTVGQQYPKLFGTSLTDKDNECVVNPVRDRGVDRYEKMMHQAMEEGRRVLAPNGIGLIVFAHKSTGGWEAQLQAMTNAGWTITGSWPIDTEMGTRMNAMETASLASSVHLICRPRENPDGTLRENEIGDWRDVLAELPKRIHEWMPRLAQEGVVGADAIFACLGPALEIFSRYARVEKASGEQVTLKEYLEYVWAAVSKEALNMIFAGADATGFEEDARLTAMWLWTLTTSRDEGKGMRDEKDESEQDDEESDKPGAVGGFILEYDTARKIAQGLGAHLERLNTVVNVKGDKARLLPVSERKKFLFGKQELEQPAPRKRKAQMSLPGMAQEAQTEYQVWGDLSEFIPAATTLDRVHQSMILFAAGRSEGLKRFLLDTDAGNDQRFWRLAQALSALYPASSDEKRWVDGVLARKKGLGF